MDFFSRVVEEGVSCSGIDDDLHALPHFFQLLLELPSLLGRHAAVRFTIDKEDGRSKIVPFHPHLVESAIEADDRADIFFLRTRVLRQRASHAEADDSVGLRRAFGSLQEPLTRAGDLALRALRVEFHEHLSRFVRGPGRLAVKQIRSDCCESLLGKAIHHIFDVRHQAPPLLNDDNGGTLS